MCSSASAHPPGMKSLLLQFGSPSGRRPPVCRINDIWSPGWALGSRESSVLPGMQEPCSMLALPEATA